jgi:hypothetical protein
MAHPYYEQAVFLCGNGLPIALQIKYHEKRGDGP